MDADTIPQTQGIRANGKSAAIINELLSRQNERRSGTPETDIIHVEEEMIAHNLIPTVNMIKEEPREASPSRVEQSPVQNKIGNSELVLVARRRKHIIELPCHT